jgi:soluble lytic murein transglycosylase-like protein
MLARMRLRRRPAPPSPVLPLLTALALALAGVAAPAPGRAQEAVEREEAPPREAGAEAALRAELAALRDRVERLEETLATALRALHAHELPAGLDFAGEPVPLARADVRERLEREFLLSAGNRAQVVLWLKRSARYFPYIEGELARAGLPDDLKYVAVIESALLPSAQSPASALGIWQFIPATGRRYGLEVTPWWDERRDPQRSTAAALAYLRDLHAQFRSWPLALAAYNAGEARVGQARERQGRATYYDLALPAETERYVFRAFAAKLILADPERHGFRVPAEQLYRPFKVDTVNVVLRDRVAVVDLARGAGSYYRELRELNPAILDEALPRGQYAIHVPRGLGPRLLGALATLERPAARREGTVRLGSTRVPARRP